MPRKLIAAVLAAASLMTAACNSAAPTEPSATEASTLKPHLNETPPDTVKRCGGMLGSGTFVC
jgi:hypothetical protein